MILAGLLYPVFAAVSGLIFFLARIFTIGYMGNAGSKNILRSIGALLGDVAILMAFGGSIKVAVEFL